MKIPPATPAQLDVICNLVAEALDDLKGDPKAVHARTSLRLAKALLANFKDELLSSVE